MVDTTPPLVQLHGSESELPPLPLGLLVLVPFKCLPLAAFTSTSGAPPPCPSLCQQAVLNTSQSEGQPQACIEVMSLGVPVMVRDIPGNLDVVRHGSNGLVFSSPEQFTTLAKRLLADKAFATGLANEGRRYALEVFASAQERNLYRSLLDEILYVEGAL